MNIATIRKEFPFLNRKYQTRNDLELTQRGRTSFTKKPLAYLDNASTTQKPKVVIDAIVDAYTNHYANIHRGVYDLSVEATDLYEGVREKVARFIGAKDSKEVISTKNTTESINLVAYCQGQFLKDGDEILLTQMEHHSNIVPFQLLAERVKTKSTYSSSDPALFQKGGRIEKFSTSSNNKRIKIKYIPITEEGRLDLSALDKLLTKKTKIVSLTLMSNVLGTINPIKKISLIVRRLAPKAIIIVDAAQAVGHMKVDVSDLACDFLAFSAPKMYGPAGVGVLWGRKELLEQMPPFMGGGDMILSVDFEKTTFAEIPWKFEAGTPSIADVIAFGEGINFVEKLGLENIRKHETELTRYAWNLLKADPVIKLYGPEPKRGETSSRGAVIAFNVDPSTSSGQVGIHPHDVASILSEEGVAIRSGHHCAQPLMSVLGIDAACRVSFGVYNTKEEIDRLMEGIEKVKKIFKLSKITGPVTTFPPASARSRQKPVVDQKDQVELRAVGSPSSRATRKLSDSPIT